MMERTKCQILAENNIGLAYYFAQQYVGNGIEYDDLKSLALVGLVKAANTFNPDNDIKFSTYAAVCIKNEIKMCFRKQKTYNQFHMVSLEEPLNDEGFELKDTIEDDDIGFDEVLSMHDDLQCAMKILTNRERQVMEMKYVMNLSQTETARILGVQQPSISKIADRALLKLRNVMVVQ